jgi:hypothetical protein
MSADGIGFVEMVLMSAWKKIAGLIEEKLFL